MEQPYKQLIQAHEDATGMLCGWCVENIVFHSDRLIQLLETNKLKKDDRHMLIDLLNLLTFDENLL